MRLFLFLLIMEMNFLFGETLGVLKEVMKPGRITVSGQEVYISDEKKIKVFSLKDLKLIREIGRAGEGPGEFDVDPRVRVFEDKLFASTTSKILWFKRNGELIKEIRTSVLIRPAPVKENYIAGHLQIPDYFVDLYDNNFKKIKTIYQSRDPEITKMKINPLFAYLVQFDVAEGKIFLHKGEKGFFLEVLDDKGEKIYEIKKDYPKVKFENWFKEKFLEDLKGGPVSIKERLVFPDYFPPVQAMIIRDGKIHLKTFKKKSNEFEFIVLTLKGDEVKKLFLPDAELWTIDGGFYYWLEFNENEEYALNRKKI